MSVQEGHQYPNVVRQLQDDGGTNNNSEWYYYDNGGMYPWPGPVDAGQSVTFGGDLVTYGGEIITFGDV